MNRDLTTFEEGEDRVKISHFTKKGYDIKGIVHVGTNDWYEYPFYKQMGIDNIIGFEPIHEAVGRAQRAYPDAKVYEVALGNHDGYMNLNIASGDGQSSTFFELDEAYKKEFPDISIVKKRAVHMMKYKTWLDLHPEFNPIKYNCLVLDVEGYELEVLKGMGLNLRSFDFLNIECSGTPTYLGGPFAQEIVDYLALRGFKQDSPIEAHNDVFFVKERMWK